MAVSGIGPSFPSIPPPSSLFVFELLALNACGCLVGLVSFAWPWQVHVLCIYIYIPGVVMPPSVSTACTHRDLI